eukprot:TRINITY_DN2208_c0_g1_i2.p1 TRINITY_DN2208_c0_g1~~TRINITY_DN2208_c0_g1_i2.p1  ORF type:complete len:519 (+),score=127.96 TRINITY_DN2208_c0_g1_i2:175-1731(+)
MLPNLSGLDSRFYAKPVILDGVPPSAHLRDHHVGPQAALAPDPSRRSPEPLRRNPAALPPAGTRQSTELLSARQSTEPPASARLGSELPTVAPSDTGTDVAAVTLSSVPAPSSPISFAVSPSTVLDGAEHPLAASPPAVPVPLREPSFELGRVRSRSVGAASRPEASGLRRPISNLSLTPPARLPSSWPDEPASGSRSRPEEPNLPQQAVRSRSENRAFYTRPASTSRRLHARTTSSRHSLDSSHTAARLEPLSRADMAFATERPSSRMGLTEREKERFCQLQQSTAVALGSYFLEMDNDADGCVTYTQMVRAYEYKRRQELRAAELAGDALLRGVIGHKEDVVVPGRRSIVVSEYQSELALELVYKALDSTARGYFTFADVLRKSYPRATRQQLLLLTEMAFPEIKDVPKNRHHQKLLRDTVTELTLGVPPSSAPAPVAPMKSRCEEEEDQRMSEIIKKYSRQFSEASVATIPDDGEVSAGATPRAAGATPRAAEPADRRRWAALRTSDENSEYAVG